MATAEHVAGVASSSSAHLQGTAEQALVAAAHHVAAAGAAQLRDAVVACQPDPRGAITARPLPTPAAAPSASQPMEEEPTPQAAPNVAPPCYHPPLQAPPAPFFPNGPLHCCPASRWHPAPGAPAQAALPPIPGPPPPNPWGPSAVGGPTPPAAELGCTSHHRCPGALYTPAFPTSGVTHPSSSSPLPASSALHPACSGAPTARSATISNVSAPHLAGGAPQPAGGTSQPPNCAPPPACGGANPASGAAAP